MRNIIKSTSVLVAIAAISILNACQKQDEFSAMPNSSLPAPSNIISEGVNTFYGPSVAIGDGEGRAWVTVNKSGNLTAVGVTLTESALEQLPDTAQAFVLPFPSQKGPNFYTHVLLDWNPKGHEPVGIYDLPHFDVHFYTIPIADRKAIGLLNPPALDKAPASIYVPPMYLETPGLVPAMGAHWVDLQSPEFNGGTFTKTYIWGSFNGKFVFWEPMVTLAYLKSHPYDLTPLRQPTAFQRTGWYAKDYQVFWSDYTRDYTIALANLAYHQVNNQ